MHTAEGQLDMTIGEQHEDNKTLRQYENANYLKDLHHHSAIHNAISMVYLLQSQTAY